MIAPAPPEGFVTRLRQYDERLRLRWGVRTSRWLIERQMPPGSRQWLTEKPSPYKSPRGLDLWDGWRQGYLHVLSVDPEMLVWGLVEQTLYDSDAAAQGGFAKLNEKLDALDAEWETAGDKKIANWSEAAASEFYDRVAWLSGNRQAVNPSEVEAPPKDVVEEHDGFTVHIKRRVSVEA